MTREEQTISNLKKLKSFHNGSYGTDIDRAIKALEQEPCDEYGNYKYPNDIELTEPNTATSIPCGDAISRQAVEKITWEEPSYTDALNVLTEVRDKIRALPPVNPQPKIGHWINGDCEGGNCSICGEYYAFYPESGDFNYCPNCGAKMVELQKRSGKE